MRLYSSAAMVLLAVFVFLSTAAAEPSSVTLGFIVEENGNFRATVKLDEEPGRNCEVRLAARISNARGNGVGVGNLNFLALKISRSRTTRFTASGMPRVKKASSASGRDGFAHLNLQVRVTCGDIVLESPAVARYLDCGRAGTSAVSASAYVSLLKRRID